MVFNQLLWSIHFKVISKLLKDTDNIDTNGLAICDIVPSDTKVFVKQIQDIVREYTILKDFLSVYPGPNNSIDIDIQSKGIYLNAFYEGVFSVLTSFEDNLYKIEKSYLYGSGISLLKIRIEFVYLKNVLVGLNTAIEKLKEEKYTGCKILDLCESFINSESPDVKEVFISIQQHCLKRFYMQIKLWLIQTVLHDPFKEFFIKASNNISSEFISLDSTRSGGTDLKNEFLSTKYEVNADYLPSLIPFSVAVKILFIGESLILCQHNEITNDNINCHLGACGISPQNIVSEFSEVENCKTFNLRSFSNFVDNLWINVNTYIYQSSVEIGKVDSELVLMWEVYLLGRDELFQEFLLKGSHLLNSDITIVTARNLNLAFRDAVYYVYLNEYCSLIDHFYFKLPNRRALKLGLTVWSVMFLDCKVKWPLRYLFTPEVLNIYNKLFCFLLKLKKAQMDLTSACKGINSIQHHSLKMEFIEVKIHLFSIVSNLQNYCLTFVIANEMNILLKKVKTATMFTELQKTLLLFLSNIANRLFLSDQIQKSDKSSLIQTSDAETVSKKVNSCFMKIFSLCGVFSELIAGGIVDDKVRSQLAKLKTNLFEILKLMFSLLSRIDQNSCHSYNNSLHIYTYLCNLMMCLDYNNFYHNRFRLDMDI